MAEAPYSRFNSERIFDLTPDHSGGGTSGDGGGMEARIAKLEADMEYIKRDVGELRSDMRDVRDRTQKIEVDVSHLPSKGFVFGAYALIAAFIVAVQLFQTQIQQLAGIATGNP